MLLFPGAVAMTEEVKKKLDNFCQTKLKSCKNLSEYVSSILLDILRHGSMSWIHISAVGFT